MIRCVVFFRRYFLLVFPVAWESSRGDEDTWSSSLLLTCIIAPESRIHVDVERVSSLLGSLTSRLSITNGVPASERSLIEELLAFEFSLGVFVRLPGKAAAVPEAANSLVHMLENFMLILLVAFANREALYGDGSPASDSSCTLLEFSAHGNVCSMTMIDRR